jgi:arginyl-tRNA synthetase
MLCALSRVEF